MTEWDRSLTTILMPSDYLSGPTDLPCSGSRQSTTGPPVRELVPP